MAPEQFALPPTFDGQSVKDTLFANFTPSAFGPPEEIADVAGRLIQLYPNVPALDSLYNTGNETFGLSRPFKQAAVIC